MEIPGYEIKGPLGRGGMGTVYLGFQVSLQREVAIKIMAPALAVDEAFSRRFLNEGRVIARLGHPNIVTVYDIGIHEHRHYLSMEFLPGGTLKQRIVEGIPLSESLRIIKIMAGALGYAHRAGFVHRDVKPQNILFRGDDTPVLTDFGIAKSVGSSSVMTVTGASVGSPKYMSPEQARGQRVDSRGDLYALGVIFYEMLTGKLPYETADPFAVALMHVSEPVPRLPEPYGPFQPILNRLMAKVVDQRFPDADQFVTALEEVEQSLTHGRTVEMTAVAPGAVSWLDEDRTPEKPIKPPSAQATDNEAGKDSARLLSDSSIPQTPESPGGDKAATPPPNSIPVEPTIYRPTPPPPTRRSFGKRRVALWLGGVAVLGLGLLLADRLLPQGLLAEQVPPVVPETPSPQASGTTPPLAYTQALEPDYQNRPETVRAQMDWDPSPGTSVYGDQQALPDEEALSVAPEAPRLVTPQAEPQPEPAFLDATDPLNPPGPTDAQTLVEESPALAGDDSQVSFRGGVDPDSDNATAQTALENQAPPSPADPVPELEDAPTDAEQGDEADPLPETETATEPEPEPIEAEPAPGGASEDTDPQARIAALQTRFDALVKSWALTSGRNGHALGVLEEIRKLDPQHPFIPQGRRRIALAYAALAQSALGKGQLARVERWLDAGERIQPGLPQLSDLRAELAAAEVAARPPEPEPTPAPKPAPPPRRETFDDIFQPNSNR